MKTTLTRVGTILATMTLFVQCQKDLEGTEVLSQQPQESLQAVDSNTDYPRLENPYSVTNMKKALESLKSKTSKGPDNAYAAVNIKPTHLYVKFIPRNEAELSAVKRDTLIELYEHPLDVEDWVIQAYFTYETASNRPPELWAAVKVGHRLPRGCPSQILERLYIPDEMKHNPRGKNTTVSHPFADELVEESFRLTGNPLNKTTAKAAKWTPSGNIKAQNRPLQGIKVRARRWLTTHVGYTDSYGNFSCDGDFRRPANYSLVYERKSVFDVRDGTFGQATVDGPKIEGAWVYNSTGGKPVNYGYVYKAAYDYFYKNPFGTYSPPSSPGLQNALKISYFHKNGGSGFEAWRSWFTPLRIIIPPLSLFVSSSPVRIFKDDHSPSKIYSVTAHELGHAAHWKLIIDAVDSNRWKDYHTAEEKLVESWAVFIETIFTRRFIDPNYDRYPFNNDYSRGGKRTEIGLELNEIVGLTAKQLENGLIQASSFDEWEENLKNANPNINYEIETVFNRY